MFSLVTVWCVVLNCEPRLLESIKLQKNIPKENSKKLLSRHHHQKDLQPSTNRPEHLAGSRSILNSLSKIMKIFFHQRHLRRFLQIETIFSRKYFQTRFKMANKWKRSNYLNLLYHEADNDALLPFFTFATYELSTPNRERCRREKMEINRQKPSNLWHVLLWLRKNRHVYMI